MVWEKSFHSMETFMRQAKMFEGIQESEIYRFPYKEKETSVALRGRILLFSYEYGPKKEKNNECAPRGHGNPDAGILGVAIACPGDI